jgi:hypothetical protein
MVTYEDCLALAAFTPEEVDLIAAHEHLPPIVALELGSYLLGTAEGERRIRRILGARAQTAGACGDRPRDAVPAAIPAWIPKPGAQRLAA